MNEIPRADLGQHLRILSDDLQRFGPNELVPWPLGRLFNELLKQTKLQLGAHPLVNTMGSVKENTDPDLHPGASNTSVGTLLGIIGQMCTSLELNSDGAFSLQDDAGLEFDRDAVAGDAL